MAVTTADQYGAPSYGALGRPVAGQIFHTPENVDPTLAQAIAVAKWQGTTGNTSGGSYHGILGHDSVKYAHTWIGCLHAAHWTMVRSVPWDQASGGVTSNHTPPSEGGVWSPERYPWIKQLVSAAAFADPNKYFHQISLSGKAAQYVTNGYPKGLVIATAEWVRILEKAYGYDAVLTLHRMWQTNRSDPGPLSFTDLVLAEYNRLYNPAPEPARAPAPIPKVYTEAEVAALVAAERSKALTALDPYKRRIGEFKELAGKAIG